MHKNVKHRYLYSHQQLKSDMGMETSVIPR